MKRLNTSKEIEIFALKKVAGKEWSYFLLKRKIKELTDNPELIDDVLDKFVEDGWLSDQRFAECYTRSTRDNKGYGPIKIKGRLLEKGISEVLISKCLYVNHPIWDRNAFHIRERKYGDIPTDIKEKHKQSTFLQSRGFTFSQINSAFLNNLPDKCADITLPEEDVAKISIDDVKAIL